MLVGLQQEGHAALLEVEDDRGVPVLGGVHVALRGGGDHQVAVAETCLGGDLDIWVDGEESVCNEDVDEKVGGDESADGDDYGEAHLDDPVAELQLLPGLVGDVAQVDRLSTCHCRLRSRVDNLQRR